VLGHGLLVVLAHGRSYQSGLALEALLREKAHVIFVEETPPFAQKNDGRKGRTLLGYGLDVGHAGSPVVVLLVGVPHKHGIELLVGADIAGVLAAGGAVAHGEGSALVVLAAGAVVRACALPKSWFFRQTRLIESY